MTLEQLLSPAVWEWKNKHEHLPDDQLLKEFDKWVVENEDLINESVKNNIDEINEYIERGKPKAKLSKLLIENVDENHVNSDAETKENKDSNTNMTQVKLFEPRFGEDIEMSINQFLQEKANSIKVIDIKYTTPVTTDARKWKWTAMVVYETL